MDAGTAQEPAGAGGHEVAAEPVECPECGGSSTVLALNRWGNCRACRTAQSRLTNPLRW